MGFFHLNDDTLSGLEGDDLSAHVRETTGFYDLEDATIEKFYQQYQRFSQMEGVTTRPTKRMRRRILLSSDSEL